MFSKLEPITPEKHENLRFLPVKSYEFAKKVHIVPLCISEIIQASRHYPIFFIDGDPAQPYALLSLVPGTNSYVDNEGIWKVPYIPAYIRQYPFCITKIQGEEDKGIFCLDPNAPHFNTSYGDPLFRADGAFTEHMEKIKEFCLKVFQEILVAKHIFRPLLEKGIITPWNINIKTKDKTIPVSGLLSIAEEKLKELDEKDLKKWVENNTMALIYAQLFSIDNLKRL